MDLITISLAIITLVNTVLGLLLIFHKERDSLSGLYAFNILMIISWSGSMVLFRLAGLENILLLTKLLYISATLIASTFLYFSFVFPEKKYILASGKRFTIFTLNILIILLIIFSDLIIVSAQISSTGENIVIFGKLYALYAAYIMSFFLYGFWVLFKKYLTYKNHEQKIQIVYLATGYAISANIAFITNLILPWFGYFELNWFGQVSTVTMVAFATIAILKHHLFNVKVIVTEIFVFSLWMFIFARMMLSTDLQNQIIDGGLFTASVIFGILLIKGVLREVKTREKIEKLAEDLERANVKLLELDRLKSEFVSIASHQLRSPLTSIKGYASMILEGSFGDISEKVRESISKIFESSKLMTISVEDFLNVSRIEQGRMKYDKVDFDLAELSKTVFDELEPSAKRRGLKFLYKTDNQAPYTINADFGKMKQVLSNLIDNSIKYTQKGSVSISVSKNNSVIQVAIKDTGVGLSKETISELFDKFIRARNAYKVNVSGTGLGLYIAKQMVEAHDGKIWVESEGEGKGSTFFVELKGI